jgi:hypothetical protein
VWSWHCLGTRDSGSRWTSTRTSLQCPYAFPHATGRKAGEPVQDVKNAFQTALEMAEIKDFSWHDLRHTFASWLIMKGASLRSVAELLGHRGLRMVMRYAHLSPAYLSAEIRLLDAPVQPSRTGEGQQKGNVPRRECGGHGKWRKFRTKMARHTGRFPQLVGSVVRLRPAGFGETSRHSAPEFTARGGGWLLRVDSNHQPSG